MLDALAGDSNEKSKWEKKNFTDLTKSNDTICSVGESQRLFARVPTHIP